jgi:hypothetical protein
LSDDPSESEFRRVRNRVLDLYAAVQVLMLLGIAVLIVYAVRLGPLTSPGAEQSFGLAVGLMFIMGAVVVHLTDRTYRVWPLGRRFTPTAPGPVTNEAWARFLRVLVIVLAGSAIAYVLGTLIA